ncbi:MAG: excinuclease ABC subunit A [Bacteroidetes bacterium RIFCSPLOWO2_12_FULL_35_15]|nr:MAG: excinuclease ABC subunit A [Bacteroidetes bacterium RIFCSPLOWO2_12_FULL_35_15]
MPENRFSESDYLEVVGARVHNLKNIDVTIPRNKLVVITGLSGSGKSSLAFDTIYAEGQRRYIESFSAYARQFLGNMERPDVDKITGLSPVISIEQKTVNKNPRSTVGTITEIYDFLRLLYARASDAYSYVTGEKMVRYSDDQILNLILEKFNDKKILILAPVVKGRKGHYRELFEQIKKWGYLRVRIDGEIQELTKRIQLDRYKVHDIEIVIDRLEVNSESRQRISESLQLAMKQGKGIIMVQPFEKGVFEDEFGKVEFYSRHLMCPVSGISYDEPQPNMFSFNSPYGACPKCNGLGAISEVDITKIIPNTKSTIRKGGIAPLGVYKTTWIFKQLEAIGEKYGFTLDTPLEDISDEAINTILFGSDEVFKIKQFTDSSATSYSIAFEGIASFIAKQNDEQSSPTIEKWIQGFMNKVACPKCNGTRLKKESLHFKIDNKNISELAEMGIIELKEWFADLETRLNTKQNTIAKEVLKEIRTRILFLLDVGLDYLTLNRSARSLSGGEAQRIRLATQIGSQLVGVLYILDEPSIGLHQRDNIRLINALKNLRDIGNSVIVVEHDKEMILAADHVIDIGPAAGVHGGKIIAQGTPSEILKYHTLTSDYINGIKEIKTPSVRRKGSGKSIVLKGATGNNLKNVSIEFPLGKLICVTGVSGSGKSTLINETLYPILNKHFYRAEKKPLHYKSITGLENIDKVIDIDQSPIGRTPRSNPATYTNVFSDIRNLYSEIPESKIRGYKPGRFSFNVKGGRCETCKGAGLRTIEMNFLPDVYVNCETCNGKRYNKETLEIRFKGKSISDVLNMTIDIAVDFFANIPSIIQKIKTLHDVGLGYITLGQQSTTLSGGEAQRVKLATELSKRDTGNTFYILDEPTTGLHFEDIRILLEVLDKLVNSGNTVLVIEHNMDIVKVADHVIDLGLEGGNAGGTILCEGPPEEIIKNKISYTAKFLKAELK